jgi:hypothetical protein
MKPNNLVELRELEEIIAFGTATCYTYGHDTSDCDFLAQQRGYPSASVAAISPDIDWQVSCTSGEQGLENCTVTVSGSCPWD